MKTFGNILWGLVFIVVGGILGLNALGITNIDVFFDGWWTLFIIVPCFIGLFKEHEKVGNIIGILIGVSLLLCCQEIFEFEMLFKLLFPAILIIIGITFIFKDVLGKKAVEEIKKINQTQNNATEYNAVFAGQDVKIENEEFRGANLNAIFGGVEFDLRKAIITENHVINVKAVFGGVDLYVPSNVKVKINSTPVFGGISNSTSQNASDDAITLYVDGVCVFGGIEIKN